MKIAYTKKAETEYVISLSKSNTKLMDFVQKFNYGKDLRDNDRIKPAVQETLKRLVYLLAKHYLDNTVNYFLQKQNIKGEYLTAKDLALPHAKSYLANYNQQEENEFKNISISTVRNHIKKLECFGLLKQVKGNSKTLLLLHPELLHLNANFDHLNDHFLQFFEFPLENLTNENRAFQEKKTQTLHPKYPNSETLNNITVTHVNNIKGIEVDNYETLNFETRKAENLKTNTETEKEKVAEKRKSNRDVWINKAILNLWLWMQTNLLSEYEFISDNQKEIAHTYFKNEFNNTSKSATFVYSELQTRLYEWKKFINRDKKTRFTPLPAQFFNPASLYGFEQTKGWLIKKEAREQKNKIIARSKGHYRKFVNTMDDKTLSYTQKMEKMRGLNVSVRRICKNYPHIYDMYVQSINEYLTNQKAA